MMKIIHVHCGRKFHYTHCSLGCCDLKNKHVELETLTETSLHTTGNKRNRCGPPSSQGPAFLSNASSLTVSLLLATVEPEGGAVMKMNASD